MNITQLIPKPLSEALSLPNGARFYRCALQVNPFSYLNRHNKSTPFQSEADYNDAVIKSCLDLDIEIIGVTDHYRVDGSIELVKAARKAGIHAFCGFEAVTKDGVHFLCLFDSEKDAVLERFIGECGIHDTEETSPIGNKDSLELLECAKRWGGICIAAHVAADQGGLLKKLSGQTRVKVWKSPELLACAIASTPNEAPNIDMKRILLNKDINYKRDRPVAIINAQDTNGPDDLKKDTSSCLIKMSEISIEGLRQAFLDSESRVRLLSDSKPEPHSEILAIAWEGGFLDGVSIHLNENLNVLIGGRGAGKSTLIESLRYAFGLKPLGDDSSKAHEGVIKSVLRNATKVSLLVKSYLPSERCYIIERTVPNPPIVKDESGRVLDLEPLSIMPSIEVFGQHEISEITKSSEKQISLLHRFIVSPDGLETRKSTLKLNLGRSQNKILEIKSQITHTEDILSSLPTVEETLKRYQEAGLEERLKKKSLLVQEEVLIDQLSKALDPFRKIVDGLNSKLPINIKSTLPNDLESLPNSDLLTEIINNIKVLETTVSSISGRLSNTLDKSHSGISEIYEQWKKRREQVEDEYEKILRELQKEQIDGEEFIRLRSKIEELRPLEKQIKLLKKELETELLNRQSLLSQWEDIQSEEFRSIEKAAKRVSKKLKGKVRVDIIFGRNLDSLFKLLREEVGGHLSAVIDRLGRLDQLSLRDLANQCREGKEALIREFNFPPGAAERISQSNPKLFMQIEELELKSIANIYLNVGEVNTPVWQFIDDLSTGQKATAILLLLLLESDSPLIIDQPEDDLDNRFITEGVVPIMRKEKCNRQFIFSTHNANVPVLGDAELILGLVAQGEGNRGQALIPKEHMGSIDSSSVRELVEEILEGGKTAFEMRRLKYGF